VSSIELRARHKIGQPFRMAQSMTHMHAWTCVTISFGARFEDSCGLNISDVRFLVTGQPDGGNGGPGERRASFEGAKASVRTWEAGCPWMAPSGSHSLVRKVLGKGHRRVKVPKLPRAEWLRRLTGGTPS